MFIKSKINSRYCKLVIFINAKTIILYNLNTIVPCYKKDLVSLCIDPFHDSVKVWIILISVYFLNRCYFNYGISSMIAFRRVFRTTGSKPYT